MEISEVHIKVLNELKAQGDLVPESFPLHGWVQARSIAQGLRNQGMVQASPIGIAGNLRYLRTYGLVEYTFFYPHGGYWRLTTGGKRQIVEHNAGAG